MKKEEIEDYLLKKYKPHGKVLNAGCGLGRHMDILDGKVIHIDIDEKEVERLRKLYHGDHREKQGQGSLVYLLFA